jgi:hypothetical protein
MTAWSQSAMLMSGCAYPCMMITINGAWLLKPYLLLAPAPNAESGAAEGRVCRGCRSTQICQFWVSWIPLHLDGTVD